MTKEYDFLQDLREWCIANPLTKEDLSGVIQSPIGFWQGKKQNRSREYTIICPDGKTIKTNCLQDFCKQNGLDQPNMCNVANGKLKQHKGYKVI